MNIPNHDIGKTFEILSELNTDAPAATPPKKKWMIVERDARKPARDLMLSDAKDYTLSSNLYLTENTSLQFKNLKINKGVRIITNGYCLNLRVLGTLDAEDARIMAFEFFDRAAPKPPGRTGAPKAPGGAGAKGNDGKFAGPVTLTVLGNTARGSLSVNLNGIHGGKGGDGGKGGTGSDVDLGPGGQGVSGGNGGDGGNGGNGGVFVLTLPPSAKETFQLIESQVEAGDGGDGGAPGPGGDPGQGTQPGERGPEGLAGRKGRPGKPGKTTRIYGVSLGGNGNK